MEQENINTMELAGVAPLLLKVNKEGQAYAVPEDYFSGFPAKMLTAAHLESLDKNVGYAVPHQYFSTFADRVLKKIEEEDTLFLNSLSKENAYSVPENYFENLSSEITAKIKQPEAKVIPLKIRQRRWQMAAAAAVAGFAAISSWFFVNKKGADKSKNGQPQYYASVLNSDSLELEQSLSGLSNSEISSYLNSPDFSDSGVTESTDVQVSQNEIDGISNEAVENYLNQTPAVY